MPSMPGDQVPQVPQVPKATFKQLASSSMADIDSTAIFTGWKVAVNVEDGVVRRLDVEANIPDYGESNAVFKLAS